MSNCPCGSNKAYSVCCGPYLKGEQYAPDPESLMRSRYTAYTRLDMAYIASTMRGAAAEEFAAASTQKWAEQLTWTGLHVLKSQPLKPDLAFVEYFACYSQDRQAKHIYEIAEFHCIDGRWYYVDGKHPKIARNQSCLCGSGKKYKRCCGFNGG